MGQGRGGFRFDIALLMLAVLGIAVGGAAVYLSDRLEQQMPGNALERLPDTKPPPFAQIEAGTLLLSQTASGIARGLPPAPPADPASIKSLSAKLGGEVGALSLIAARSDERTQAAAAALERAWAATKSARERMLAAESNAARTTQDLQELRQASDQVTQLYRTAIDRMRAGYASSNRLLLAGEQLTRAEHLWTLARRLIDGGGQDQALATQIESEVAGLLSAHEQLLGEGPVGSFLRDNTGVVENAGRIARGLAGSRSSFELRAAANALAVEAVKLRAAAGALPEGGSSIAPADSRPPPRHPMRAAILPALGTALAASLLYAAVNFGRVRRRVRRAGEKEVAQQAAILTLLEEISSLADGDLTVRASVTGEFTGAIADAINYTIDTLRRLVGTINQTAVEISAAAAETQSTAQIMREASDNQARDVVQIALQVSTSSYSLTAVAARAEELSQQAAGSVSVAHHGAATVGRTIQGMTALREQIQDTAKRIKRLGESSQEIGTIIEFINDIAEQTHTLALNASIQAAMAGESGRGFSAVAEQVQRLAERAAASTRQIETLVKTIQADTSEAIVSMERSTSNVVAGARSAEEAGQSLTRIESTSTDLARLIQEISSEARAESAQATTIADEMHSIREVAQQTAAWAQSTAEAVGELEVLSDKLRRSVAGFKLPSDPSRTAGASRKAPTLERRD